VVAVVDTGVDYNHPDLAANMWRAPAAFSVTIGGRTITCAAGTRGFNAITNTCDPLDDQDHGTHVAGTIGAVGNNGTGVVGVSQVARIMALKFLNAQGTGTVSDAIKAIEFAIATKTYFASTNGANVRILNNSWGGDGFSQALLDTIRRAHQADMLFVASAGNDSFDIDFKPTYPASYKEPNVITVAATNNRDDRAWFSNYGATSVHLAAPGDSILSTIRTNGYKILSGTSMASPHVSGAAALILSNCPVGTTGLKDILLRSVDKIPAMSGITTTGGRLNVASAVNSCTVPYYTLAATPAEATIGLGMTGKYTVTITPFKAFAGAVTMSVADLPAGVTATFQPATVPVNGVVTSSILTLSVGANVLPGVHRFTIQGASANQQRTTWASVRIPGYAVADLGSLPVSGGTRLVEARDVNNSGQVVGTSNATASGSVSTYKHAFLYSGGVMRDLGTLGGVISSAASVSGPGHVVGSSHTSIGYEHAFLYSAGKMIDLGTLPGHYDSFATGVNDSGHVVGYSAQSSSNERAFLRTTGALVNLGTLPNGNRSRATGLNNLGHVVGYSQTTNYSEHAFLYSNGTMKDLGTIGANASGNSHARAINDAGQIAGWSTVGSNLSTVHAFLYSAGKVQDLGALPGYPFSYANGLNGSGHVVGFVAMEEERFAGEKKRAFLYRNGRMLDLNETLQPGSAWVLLEATAINDNGAIAGVGKMNGETRAFLLTPLQ
jgi:probable HAF family extracellular repeat protein